MRYLPLLAAGGALLAAVPAHSASTLYGFASLAADTFYDGPTSGQFGGSGNGRSGPYVNKQPVQGVSAILSNGRGGYSVMSDNGFGNKANSADALLVVHDMSVDFRTAAGGTGTVTVNSSNPLSDPNRLLGYTIQADLDTYYNAAGGVAVDQRIKDNKYLTGADLDVESFRRLSDGTYYFGDEFGPFLVHTDANFRVIDDAISLPGVRSPDNPLPGGPSNLPSSGGFEGMALTASGDKLYTLLEGRVAGDPAGSLRINAFDIAAKAFTDEDYFYQLSAGGTNIGDMTALRDTQFLVIERDGGQGDAALFKKVFLIDFNNVDAQGNLIKTEIADLLNIADPDDLNGDGSNLFKMPFVTIEDILPIDAYTFLIGNDNNYPGSSGRTPGVPDNNEFLLLRLDQALPGFAAPVPEPATWAMMMAGFGLVGGAMRRRTAALRTA